MRNQKGITLIALVVTIIVLLILAGVTITYALSDNGIFKKAQEAQAAAEQGTIRDAVSTAEAEALIEYYDSSKVDKSTFATLIASYLTSDKYTLTGADAITITTGVIAKGTEASFTAASDKYTHTVKVKDGVVTDITSEAK